MVQKYTFWANGEGIFYRNSFFLAIQLKTGVTDRLFVLYIPLFDLKNSR